MLERNYFVLSVVVCVGLLLGACQSEPPFECTDALGCVTIAPGESIKLGALQTISGDMAEVGTAHIRSIELALDQRDDQLLGHPIEVQYEDSQCSEEGGANAALKVVADPQVVAIIGPVCSSAGATAGEIMSEAGLVMISGLNSAPSLTAVGGERGAEWQPGYYRTIASDVIAGQVAATFAIQELGLTRVATIHDGSLSLEQIADVFGQTFTELGGEVVLATSVNVGDTDMRPVLTAVANSGAEFLYLPLFSPEGDLVVQQVKEIAGLENLILMGEDALLSDTFLESVGADAAGIYFSVPGALDDSALAELTSKYEAKYGEPIPAFSFYGFVYDATTMALEAIEAVAVQEEDGTLHIGRQALREALYATADFEGMSGRLSCDEFGDCAAIGFNIVRLDDPAAGLEGARANVVYAYDPGGGSND